MSISRALRKHLLLLAVIAVSVAGVRIGFWHQQAEALRSLGQKAAGQRSREMESSWQAFHYREASGSSFGEEFVSNVHWSGLDLSEVQLCRLRTRLFELMQYLRDPTFEEFFRLKTEGVHYRFELTSQAKILLGERPSASITQGTKQTTRLVWDAAHAQTQNSKPPRITAVCMETIAAALSSTNSPTGLIAGKVGKGFTRAVEAMNPGFYYAGHGSRSSKSPQESPVFYLSFFAKANGSYRAGPVYISLCWLAVDQNWALSRMIVDDWLGVRTVF